MTTATKKKPAPPRKARPVPLADLLTDKTVDAIDTLTDALGAAIGGEFDPFGWRSMTDDQPFPWPREARRNHPEPVELLLDDDSIVTATWGPFTTISGGRTRGWLVRNQPGGLPFTRPKGWRRPARAA